MGWTGMFDWSSNEKNVDILNRELFSGNKLCVPLKWSSKGSHVWILYKSLRNNRIYASVIMTCRNKKNHEFLYKEMGLDVGPCFYDMPKTWVPLIKYSYKDEEYAQKWLKAFEEKQNKPALKFEVGNVLKCRNKNGAIEWVDGFSIPENSEFFITVTGHKTPSRIMKEYVIADKEENRFVHRFYRISSKTFKNLEVIEVIQGGVL